MTPFFQWLTSLNSLSPIISRPTPKSSRSTCSKPFSSRLCQSKQARTAADIQEPSSSTLFNLSVKTWKSVIHRGHFPNIRALYHYSYKISFSLYLNFSCGACTKGFFLCKVFSTRNYNSHKENQLNLFPYFIFNHPTNSPIRIPKAFPSGSIWHGCQFPDITIYRSPPSSSPYHSLLNIANLLHPNLLIIVHTRLHLLPHKTSHYRSLPAKPPLYITTTTASPEEQAWTAQTLSIL